MTARTFFKGLLNKVAAPVDAGRSAERRARETIEVCRALLSERGEVSGAALAREVLAAYRALPAAALKPFLQRLAVDFAPDAGAIAHCAGDFLREASPQHLHALQKSVESPRQEFFRRLNVAPGATAVLVDLRRQVLRELKVSPQLAVVDADLAHLFESWFNRGFLRLERIDWRTPAIVLEKLIAYEAVHEIAGWKDLRRRLADDRRCFGFFHPALPDEPLIFIEVALTEEVSATVAPLLDPDAAEGDPARAQCAIFYSITNCQEGLRGISFGNLLIKQVVEELSREFPRLKTFATLSPVPGLHAWLTELTRKDAALADALAPLQNNDWLQQPATAAALQAKLMPLCACYLLRAKRESGPLDPVARFHLGNGARLDRLNWLADTSRQGMQRAAGLMVNYVYRLDEVEQNHEAFVREGVIAAAHGLKKLARECAPLLPAIASRPPRDA